MRKADEAFVAKLQSYDRLLDAVWVERDEVGRLVQRWRILRKHPDGRPRHIMFVVEPGGGFRPLDDRVLEHLHRCDTHRFADADDLLRAFDAENDLQKRMACKDVHDRRYWPGAEEMADRLAHALKKDNMVCAMGSEKEVAKELKRADARQEVAAAYEAGEGVIEMDKELGCPVVSKKLTL